MKYNKWIILVVLLIVASCYEAISAGERIFINIGSGFGGFNTKIKSNTYHVPQPELPPLNDVKYSNQNGYSIYVETLFPATDNLNLGIGIQHLISTSGNIDEAFFDRYDLTGNSKADVNITMPYLAARYRWSISGVELYSKLNIGYGFGRLKTKSLFVDETEEANGFGITPRLGMPFRISDIIDFNIECGYWYIKTSAINDDYYSNRLDFSGPFVQGGISFRL